jgi:hypothetical protein
MSKASPESLISQQCQPDGQRPRHRTTASNTHQHNDVEKVLPDLLTDSPLAVSLIGQQCRRSFDAERPQGDSVAGIAV